MRGGEKGRLGTNRRAPDTNLCYASERARQSRPIIDRAAWEICAANSACSSVEHGLVSNSTHMQGLMLPEPAYLRVQLILSNGIYGDSWSHEGVPEEIQQSF
jgi:hypothetical protein